MKNAPISIIWTLLLGSLFYSTPASGQTTLYWDPTFTGGTNGGGTGTWSTGTNWFNGTADVAWTAGSIAVFGGTAGTVTLSANETVGGMTFNTTGYSVAVTGSDTITLTGAPAITVASGSATIRRPIAGAGIPLTVAGSGTLVLAATNTYSGTTINAGSTLLLVAANGQGAGTGAFTNNGILTFNSTNSSTVAIANSFTGAGVVNFGQSANYNISGSWGAFNGTINLVPNSPNADELLSTTVATVNSLSNVTINIGAGHTVAWATTGSTCPATIILNGPGNTVGYGAFRYDNGTQTGPVFLNGTNNWIGSDGGILTISGPISDTNSGSGIVIVARSTGARDIVVFAGANIYTGTTTLSNGTLRLAIAENPGVYGPLGLSTNIVFAGTGTTDPGILQYSSANQYDYSGRFSTAAGQNYIIDVNGQAVTFANPLVSSAAPFTLLDTAGGGTLTLNAANTYTGGTTVSNGTLIANVTGAIPGAVTISGGTLIGNAADAVSGNITVVNSGVLVLSNASVLSPFAMLTLPASPADNSVNLAFTGTQNISALYFGSNPQAVGTWGAIGSSAVNQSSAFTGGGILNVSVPSFSSAYWDPGALDASPGSGGAGSWNSAATDWFNGSSDTTWPANAIANFAGAAGTVTLGASETAFGTTFTTSGYLITNSSGAILTLGGVPTVSVASGTATIGCPISVGIGGLTESGSGTLILSANNTISGALTVSNALIIAGSGELGGGNHLGNIIVPGSFIYDSSAAQTLSGTISDGGTGIGTLTQEGTGTLTLSGSNSYGGGTTIAQGSTLLLTSPSGAGAGAGPITNNGILTFNANNGLIVTVANQMIGTSNAVINFYQNANYSLTGSWAGFSGTVNLVPNGANANEVILNSPNPLLNANYTFNVGTGQTLAISVSGGVTCDNTVILNGPGNSVGFGALRIDVGTQAGPVLLAGTNSWIGSDGGSVTFTGPISDTNSGNGIVLVARPTGVADLIVFAGANTYTGTTTLSNGTLQLGIAENPGVSGPLGLSTVVFAGTGTTDPGTLQYSSANQYDYSGRFGTAAGQNYIIDVNGQTITFASPLTSSGAPFTLMDSTGGGILTLSATNTYSGGTTISNGTLIASVAGAVPGNVTLPGGSLVGGAAASIAGSVTVGVNGILTLSNANAMSSGATLTLPDSPFSGQVNLNFSGTQFINALYLGTNQQLAGLYGASTNNPDGVFNGTGTLFVGSLPPITISRPTISSNQLTISWSSVAGGAYNLSATTNLQPPITWTNLNSSPISATGTNTSFTVPGPVTGQLFLRIQQ